MPAVACLGCDKVDNLPMIRCDGCCRRIHVSCAELDTDDAQRLTRNKTKGMKYFCKNCSASTDKFAELKAMLSNISERLSQLENPDRHILSPEVFETIISEVRDRERRETNIIVYGVPESSSDGEDADTQIATNLLRTIKSDDAYTLSPDKVRRLGSRRTGAGSRPRPIRVILSSRQEVTSVLRNKNKARNQNRFKDFAIKMDETPYQRDLLKNCRQSLREREDAGEHNLTIKYIKGIPTIIQKN